MSAHTKARNCRGGPPPSFHSLWNRKLKKRWKQDCTHVDHNHRDPLPSKIIHHALIFVVAQALCGDFKATTILEYMIPNGKGSIWLWPKRQPRLHSHINRAIQNSWLLLNRTFFFLLVFQALLTAPCRVSYSFLRGHGNIAQEITTVDILISATASIGHGNS